MASEGAKMPAHKQIKLETRQQSWQNNNFVKDKEFCEANHVFVA